MKNIGLIITNLKTTPEYANTFKSIFGNLVEIIIIDPYGCDKSAIIDIDLFLMHKGTLTKEIEAIFDFPLGIPIVNFSIDFTDAMINQVAPLPDKAQCLFVNISEALTNESITQLQKAGVNHVQWIPADPAMEWSFESGFDYVITPGETELLTYKNIPSDKLIDTGIREVAPETIIQIAKELGLNHSLQQPAFLEYLGRFSRKNYRTLINEQKEINVKEGIDVVGNVLEEGIIAINEFYKIISINQKAADFLNLSVEEACGAFLPQCSSELFIDFENDLDIPNENILKKYNNRQLSMSIFPILKETMRYGNIFIIHGYVGDNESKRSIQKQKKRSGNLSYAAKFTFDDIIGKHESIVKMIRLGKKFAKFDGTLLITGETGTGKEVFASAVHNHSNQADHPFVSFNCSALPEKLLESELFGYAEGILTGSKKTGKPGLFEIANNGTLFLDEIENMSMRMQAKLLRVLEKKEVMRIGGTEIIPVHVRIIAATNINLNQLKDNGIRKDLFYRLATLQLFLPPLRKRKEDIPILLSNLLKQKGATIQIDPDVLRLLQEYPWEGNVRELDNVAEYFICLEKPSIHFSDIPEYIAMTFPNNKNDETSRSALPEKELFILEQLFEAHQNHQRLGRKSLAHFAEAEGLFITEAEVRTILRKMEQFQWITSGVGRAGSQITPRGIFILMESKTI